MLHFSSVYECPYTSTSEVMIATCLLISDKSYTSLSNQLARIAEQQYAAQEFKAFSTWLWTLTNFVRQPLAVQQAALYILEYDGIRR